jgi:predicted DNA-binding protein with PD1-like motif
MRYSEGKIGRVFVLRLEDGDKIPDTIELFAQKKRISCAMCIVVGGIQGGGEIVVGPSEGDAMPPVPMLFELKGVHEILAIGTIFPDDEGNTRLHMHAALGRQGVARVGCTRPGVEVWKLGEVIVLEITDSPARRQFDQATGFEMLEP